MDKPLAKFIHIEGEKIPNSYEGIGALCFNCENIGHNEDHCPEKVSIPAYVAPMTQAIEEDNFGPWMVVQYKKTKKTPQGGNQNSNSLQRVVQTRESDKS
ncbi:Zinc knuckle CX2CX4HX4C [Corchorus olitorius]|uniref:Zinc knuckle CX2CX4HX4C n=1 Tax=Corchorus olitorius TaxID=93759 RepID=A0A1R3GTT4_9ROSI|nr:Zinc knuckle CX2CX4HX4C [Corchorus olitorius]